MASSISVLALGAAIGSLVIGGQSWVDGTARTEANDHGQRGIRFVCDQLQSAMAVTVAGDGRSLTYQMPAVDVNGAVISPAQWDGTNRSIALNGTNLQVTTGAATRNLVRGVVTTDPLSGATYRIFTAGAGTITRALTVEVVTSRTGSKAYTRQGRYRETVFLRNIPELVR